MSPRPSIPHPLVLLVGGIVLAALPTWVLPAGEYGRRDDPATGRSVPVAGSYPSVEAQPVGPFGATLAIPRALTGALAIGLT